MPAKAAIKKPSSAQNADFAAVFAALRAILAPYHSPEMRATVDTPSQFYLETTFPVFRGRPVSFAGARVGKGYVTYHLVPIYMNPALQKQLSPELKKRMQGKGCFNFKAVDQKLFAELGRLTAQGLEMFKKLAAEDQRVVPGKARKSASAS